MQALRPYLPLAVYLLFLSTICQVGSHWLQKAYESLAITAQTLELYHGYQASDQVAPHLTLPSLEKQLATDATPNSTDQTPLVQAPTKLLIYLNALAQIPEYFVPKASHIHFYLSLFTSILPLIPTPPPRPLA